MAPLWSFVVPSAVSPPLETDGNALTIWTRIREDFGSTLAQLPSGAWIQYDVNSPQTIEPSNFTFFGPQGFSGMTAGGSQGAGPAIQGTVLSEQMGMFTPLRLYRGGHKYVVDQTLHDELVAATTTQYPTGYASFLLPTSPAAGPVGDDVILGGYTATNPWGQVLLSTWGQLFTPNSPGALGATLTWGSLRSSYWGEFRTPAAWKGK